MSITKPTKPYTFINLIETADATKVNANYDTVYSAVDNVIDAVNLADGSKPSLSERLAVSINDDGTMKSGTTYGGEWIDPALTPAYVSTSTFTVTGDQTDIYLTDRRLKITLAGGPIYTEVVSAVYTTSTLVTIADSTLTDPISTVEHGMLTPAPEINHSLPVSDFIGTLFNDADASTLLTSLGFSTFGKTLIDDADASTFLTNLGFTTFIKTLIDDADAATARATLGNVPAASVALTCKVMQIGDWDMDTDILTTVAHGLTATDIRSVTAYILNDTGTGAGNDINYQNDTGTGNNGISVTGSNIVLYRATGGVFDTTDYNATSFNRGWITIWHV